MTTVGYGDGYPATHLGRLVMLLACISGRFILSLLFIFFKTAWSHDEFSGKLYDALQKLKGQDPKLFLTERKRLSVFIKKSRVYK